MTNRTHTRILLLALVAGLTACGSATPSSPTPTPPQPRPQQPVPPASGFALSGVTLFGVVFETTPAGQAPIADVSVYCDACGEFGHTWVRTDANGYYSFGGDLGAGGGIWLSGRPIPLSVGKEGYQDPAGLPPPSAGSPTGPGWREVTISGDTRFDIQLVRR